MIKTPETNLRKIREKFKAVLEEAQRIPADVLKRADPEVYHALDLLTHSVDFHVQVRSGSFSQQRGMGRPVLPPQLNRLKTNVRQFANPTSEAKLNEFLGLLGNVVRVAVKEEVREEMDSAVNKLTRQMSVVGNRVLRGHNAGTAEAKPDKRTRAERRMLNEVKNRYLAAKKENPNPSVYSICDGLQRKARNSPFVSTAQLRNAFVYDKKNFYAID